MHKIYELKDMLCEELEEYGSKEKLDVGDLEIVDKLAHAIKNLDKIIQKYEEEEGYSERGSYEGSYDSSYEGRNGSYARNSRGRDSRYGRSYARGMSRRNGRYSNGSGYSRDDSMIMELRELMEDAPNEKTRMEFQKFISKIEGM